MLPKATLTPSPHAEAAKALIEKIRALRDEIPRFSTEGLGNPRALNGGAVPEQAMEAVSAAIQSSPRLETVGGADATTLREAHAYAIAYDPVVQELLALAKFVSHSVRLQRTAAGQCARDVYALAKRLSKRKDGAELLPFVEDMSKKLNRGRRRKASSDPVSVPPAPVLPAPLPKV